MSYLEKHSKKRKTATPQSERLNKRQKANSAGGFSFVVTPMERLRRFLILGSEGGSYYATENKLTKQNTKNLSKLIKSDGVAAVNEIIAVSEGGRAPKNDQALFALAVAITDGDKDTKRAAAEALPRVARTGTHLFMFLTFVEGMRGWGRTLRWAVKNWYSQDVSKLAVQAVKYRQRDGWTHRDALRLGSPGHESTLASPAHANLYNWITKDALLKEGTDELRLIEGFLKAQASDSPKATVGLISEYNLPREALKTEHLNDPLVWEALLYAGKGMPMTAMMRNLATMTRIGLIKPNSDALKFVLGRLRDEKEIRKARIHPLNVLMAARTYASGQGFRGSNTWTPVTQITSALDKAFYTAFGNIETTGLRYLLALDVSGSMVSPMGGFPISCRDASAALALVTAATEPDTYETVGFTSGNRGTRDFWNARSSQSVDALTPLGISPDQRLEDAINVVSDLPFGGTDCALPMLYAMEHEREVDVFVVYTDSETWAGNIHPPQALKQYRDRSGIPAKLIVVGMVSNGFTIADPEDAGMLDVVGFDTATPQIIADFGAGSI